MTWIANYLAKHIGDCIGAVGAGLFFIVVSHRDPTAQALLYLGFPLLIGGAFCSLVAFVGADNPEKK